MYAQLAAFATLALSLSTTVDALIVPRATQPAGWLTAVLEPYDTYHARYMALSCNTKHSTAFFDQCCHPLLATQTAASLPAACSATTTDSGDDDDDLPFCDEIEDGDDDSSSSVAVPAPATSKAPAPTTTPAAPKVTTPAPAPKPATTTPKPAAKPAATPAAPATNAAVNTGGFATFFYQNGVAGACGTVHKDSDFIAAIDGDRYGNLGAKSSLCGKQVKLTNTKNNKSVTVTIADACPTCVNSNSIDLSEGAFKSIATLDEGMVPISWSFL